MFLIFLFLVSVLCSEYRNYFTMFCTRTKNVNIRRINFSVYYSRRWMHNTLCEDETRLPFLNLDKCKFVSTLEHDLLLWWHKYSTNFCSQGNNHPIFFQLERITYIYIYILTGSIRWVHWMLCLFFYILWNRMHFDVYSCN